MGEAGYQQMLSPGFMALADVCLVVADQTFHAHSHFLASVSTVLEAALHDIKPPPTAEKPWIIQGLLQGYSSTTVDRFLSAVYRSPTCSFTVDEAWDLLDIADHLDCKQMLEVLRNLLESQCGALALCHGMNRLLFHHGPSGCSATAHWQLHACIYAGLPHASLPMLPSNHPLVLLQPSMLLSVEDGTGALCCFTHALCQAAATMCRCISTSAR